MRTMPSTRLNIIWPPRAGSHFLSWVAASNGRYLYMKIKNATEMMMLAVANQLPTVAAFSWFSGDLATAELRSGSAALDPPSAERASFCIMSSRATLAEKRRAR